MPPGPNPIQNALLLPRGAVPIPILGIGAVSPAGWGVARLAAAVRSQIAMPVAELPRPGHPHGLRAMSVPAPEPAPSFRRHPRFRRASPIARFAQAAAIEAIAAAGETEAASSSGALRVGWVFCAYSGCVQYTRRFFDEVLLDPATASPILFPETVYNAPASHMAAWHESMERNYTLVGDGSHYLQGLAIAAEWLLAGVVDRCMVVAAEELDWLTGDAFQAFSKDATISEGAGALYLGAPPVSEETTADRNGTSTGVFLTAISDPQSYCAGQDRPAAIRAVREQVRPASPNPILCDGLQGIPKLDRSEEAAWTNWTGPRLSPKRFLGEAFVAAAAWQCVVAIDSLQSSPPPTDSREAWVSVAGGDQAAIAARFASAQSRHVNTPSQPSIVP